MPSPEITNPHYPAVLAHTIAWGQEYGIQNILDPSKAREHAQISAGVAGEVGSNLDREACAWFANKIAFFFWLDTWADGESMEEEASAAAVRPPEFYELLDTMGDVIARPQEAEHSPNPYIKMLGRTALRTAEQVNPWQFEYWSEWMQIYGHGLTVEMDHLDTGTAPNLEDFITLRQMTGAVHVVTLDVAAEAGLRLPKELWDHPALQEARELTSHIVAWINDIVSFASEAAKGRATLNLISILRTHRRAQRGYALDEAAEIQDAKEEATAMCSRKEAQLRAIRERPEQEGADPLILQYIDTALFGWIHGYRNYVDKVRGRYQPENV